MEMEIVVPIHKSMDFDFNSARSSPLHFSSPSTPKGFGEFYCSAPTSPTRLSQMYREFDDFLIASSKDENFSKTGAAAAVPFDWEEKPGTPKSPKSITAEDDFAFDIGDDFEIASLSARELFDGGVIKPLKPPPRFQLPAAARINGSSSSVTPRSPTAQGKKIIMGAFSPRHKKESEPFSPAAQKATRRTPERERGRERAPPGLKSSSRRATRSLSPLRVSQYPWEEEEQQKQLQQNKKQSSTIAKPVTSSSSSGSSTSTTTSALASFSKGYKRWRLKDFFLFRSASEGRAADKDPLKKNTAAFRRYEEVKSSSMRGTDSPSSSGSVSSRRKGPVSAHELHYTVNKAVSEDLKKKTFLPYKQGILGRLAFNPAVHALSNGFGLSHK